MESLSGIILSVYIECYGRNEEDLQSTIRAVEEKLITANISAERLIRQQREGFLSVSPLGRDYFLADANNFPSQTVAACYPCSYSSRLDLHGMFLGYGGIMSVSEEKTWNACRLTGNI